MTETGYLDSNGKMIREGDRVKTPFGGIWTVYWEPMANDFWCKRDTIHHSKAPAGHWHRLTIVEDSRM